MYIVDTNVFITAEADHYRHAFESKFWDWLVDQHEAETIGSIPQVYRELTTRDDTVAQWARDHRSFSTHPHRALTNASATSPAT